MNLKHCFFVALLVYLLVSFVPALALPNILGKGKRA